MFELHVTDTNVSTGSIAVGWCLDKETLEALHEAGNKNPQVVLAIAPAGDDYNHSREVRKVVPLKDLVAYLEFKRAGKMNIWGFISKTNKPKDVQDQWLSKNSRNEYRCDILNPTGRTYNPEDDMWDPQDRLDSASPVTVEIPPQAFAKEPPVWEQRWVNDWFKTNPVDQCAFRRRRLFAYTVQPPLTVLMSILKMFLTVIAVLYGARDLSPTIPFHPYATLADAIDQLDNGTVFIGRGKSTFWNWIRLPFMPFIALSAATIVGLMYVHGTLFSLLMGLLGLAAIGIGVVGSVFGYAKYLNWLESQDAWYLDDNEVNLIVCSNDKKPLTLDQLPSHHRTLRLRFRALKSQVCRPFAA